MEDGGISKLLPTPTLGKIIPNDVGDLGDKGVHGLYEEIESLDNWKIDKRVEHL